MHELQQYICDTPGIIESMIPMDELLGMKEITRPRLSAVESSEYTHTTLSATAYVPIKVVRDRLLTEFPYHSVGRLFSFVYDINASEVKLPWVTTFTD